MGRLRAVSTGGVCAALRTAGFCDQVSVPGVGGSTVKRVTDFRLSTTVPIPGARTRAAGTEALLHFQLQGKHSPQTLGPRRPALASWLPCVGTVLSR